MTVHNKFAVGDRLEIIHPADNFDAILTCIENADCSVMDVAPGSGHTVWVDFPATSLSGFVARYVAGAEPSAPAQVEDVMLSI